MNDHIDDKELAQRMIACLIHEDTLSPAEEFLFNKIMEESYSHYDYETRRLHLDALEQHIMIPPDADKKVLVSVLKFLDLTSDPGFTIVLHQNGTQSVMPRHPVHEIVDQKEIDAYEAFILREDRPPPKKPSGPRF